MKHPVTNLALSVMARLKNVALQKNWNFNQLLFRYAVECFLRRLAGAPEANQFVLKGGNLFVIWQRGWSSRPTMDADFLCRGDWTPGRLESLFGRVCRMAVEPDDGVTFDSHSIRSEPIREGGDYPGTRLRLIGHLGNVRLSLQFDIGIGDAVTPAPRLASFPVLLDGGVPRIRVYPKETVVAEKFHTMVLRGIADSRMKDFYDVWLMTELFEFDGELLHRAIAATFKRRRTELPREMPLCLTDVFYSDSTKIAQWRAFIRRNKPWQGPVELETVIGKLAKLFRKGMGFPRGL